MHYKCGQTAQTAVVWSSGAKRSRCLGFRMSRFEAEEIEDRGKSRKTWDESEKKNLTELGPQSL